VKRIILTFLSAALLLPATANVFADDTGHAGVYNVLDFGAKGDGAADDTATVQKAVDACVATGGGHVVLRVGKTPDQIVE
jgi:hypothetical protein